MKCEKGKNGWICEYEEDEIYDTVAKDGLKGFYDMLLKATLGVSYDNFNGKIKPWEIKIPNELDKHILSGLNQYYKDENTAEVMFMNKAPSHYKKGKYGGKIFVSNEAFITYQKEIVSRKPEVLIKEAINKLPLSNGYKDIAWYGFTNIRNEFYVDKEHTYARKIAGLLLLSPREITVKTKNGEVKRVPIGAYPDTVMIGEFEKEGKRKYVIRVGAFNKVIGLNNNIYHSLDEVFEYLKGVSKNGLLLHVYSTTPEAYGKAKEHGIEFDFNKAKKSHTDFSKIPELKKVIEFETRSKYIPNAIYEFTDKDGDKCYLIDYQGNGETEESLKDILEKVNRDIDYSHVKIKYADMSNEVVRNFVGWVKDMDNVEIGEIINENEEEEMEM